MRGLGATNLQASFSRGEKTQFLTKHKCSEYMFAVLGVESRLTFKFTRTNYDRSITNPISKRIGRFQYITVML